MSQRSRGVDHLNRRMKSARGVEVTYTREGSDPVTITAWDGRTLFAVQPRGEGGARAEWGERDYLIVAADMTEAGLGEPQPGDRITEDGVTYELMPSTTEPAWRWADQERARYRLHCKAVS
jgi:hypothetical protein